ncbi:MAG: hypothetical protein JSS66_11670 [Armatimonadetes bacterium]|nr:hypothetical protein [Armatimonadota bacterium]
MLTLAAALVMIQPADPNGTMHRSVFAAKSDLPDTQAAGGFCISENASWGMKEVAVNANKLTLLVKKNDCCGPAGGDCERLVALANGTKETLWFSAEDSVIGVVRQAQDVTGQWKPVEYWGGSDCGNSFHHVALLSGRCWVWNVPQAKAGVTTKNRYAFFGQKEPLYSNEFDAKVEATDFLLGPTLTADYSLQPTGRLAPKPR